MGVLTDGWNSPPYIALYAMEGISVSCSCYVVQSLLRSSPLKVIPTRLIFYLHVTLILEDIISMPYAFAGSRDLCISAAFIWTYVSLSRILIVACLVIMYRNIIFEDSLPTLKSIVTKWSEWIIFVFPAIPASMPFITNSFGGDGIWCAITHGPLANMMALIALYGWAWVLLGLTFLVMLRTVVQVYRIDREMTSKLFTAVGYYVVLALLSWVPRTEERIYRIVDSQSNPGYYVDSIALYTQGMIFFWVYIQEKNSILKFDDFAENAEFRYSSEDTRGSSNDPNRTSTKSLIVNPFYRGSTSTARAKSMDSQIKVTLVLNPVVGDNHTHSHNSSSGKVVFEGIDDKAFNNL